MKCINIFSLSHLIQMADQATGQMPHLKISVGSKKKWAIENKYPFLRHHISKDYGWSGAEWIRPHCVNFASIDLGYSSNKVEDLLCVWSNRRVEEMQPKESVRKKMMKLLCLRKRRKKMIKDFYSHHQGESYFCITFLCMLHHRWNQHTNLEKLLLLAAD